MRTSGVSGSVYDYIDMFLDNSGDPNTAAAVDQMENHAKHRKASQSNQPLPWGCISTARVAADSLPVHSQGQSQRWVGRQGSAPGWAGAGSSPQTLISLHPIVQSTRAVLLNIIPILLSASEGKNIKYSKRVKMVLKPAPVFVVWVTQKKEPCLTNSTYRCCF